MRRRIDNNKKALQKPRESTQEKICQPVPKNIVILTDSRGYKPSMPNSWIEMVSKKLSKSFRLVPKLRNIRLDSLYSLSGRACEVARRLPVYIIILQCGQHEMVVSWPVSIWKHKMQVPNFSEKNLIQIGELYQYRDLGLVKKSFDDLKARCDRVLLIGMHSWIKGSGQKQWDEYCFHESILNMNDVYSRHEIDYFDLPMHPSWVEKHSYDKTHYNPLGDKYISDFVMRYITRKLFTFQDVYSDNLNNERMCEVDGATKPVAKIWESAKELAGGIEQQTSPGDIVCIGCRSSFYQLEVFLGCILSHRIPIIIPHPSHKVKFGYFKQKMQKVSDALNPSICVSDEIDKCHYQEFFETVCDITRDPSYRPSNSDPNDIAFAQLSSGTTGIPKIIKVSHKQAIVSCLEYAEFLPINKEDSVVSWLPLYHDMGLVACFLLPLIKGCQFIHMSPFAWLSDPDLFFRKIEQYSGTHVWLPNFAFSYLSKRSTSSDLGSLKKVVNCSEICKTDDMLTFIDRHHKSGLKKSSVCISYAMAENVFAVTQSLGIKSLKYNGERITSCGTSIPGTSVIVVKDGKDVTEESEGELHVKSSYQPFVEQKDFYGYYPTGDYGFIDDGEVYVLGRLDDVIVSYGRNIFPYETEQAVSQLNEVKSGRVVVLGIHCDKIGTENIHICVETEDRTSKKDCENSIRKCVSNILEASFRIHVVENAWIIKTSSGKASRTECRKKLKEMLKKS